MAKKRKIKNIINWLKDAVLKSLVILLVVVFGYYAYAQITWPADNPNPVSGVVGMFVGTTPPTSFYDGDSGGYENANDFCGNVEVGSHICTAMEMINSYNHKNAESAINDATTGMAWINNGPPGYVKYVTNDCNGWQTAESTVFGSIWDFSENSSFITPCNQSLFFACCK